MTDTRDDFVVSWKPHPGYDAPLLAIKAASAAELADKIGAAEATGLFSIIGNADAGFKAAFNLGSGLGAQPVEHPSSVPTTGYAPPAQSQSQPQRQAQPQPSTPPGMETPRCPHGTKVYKTGNSRKGPWAAWMCPARQGTPSQCPPEWL